MPNPDRPLGGSSWYVYIVRCSDESLYTGVAKDVPARIMRHNTGRGAKYTRSRQPVKLVYAEPARNRAAALQREHAIRRMGRDGKMAMIRRGMLR